MPQIAPIIGEIAVNLAIGVGLSVLSSIIAPQAQAQTTAVTTSKGFDFQMTVGESQPVSAIFGIGRASGRLNYINEYGTDNEYVQLMIDIGYGEHEGLYKFLVDGKAVALSGSNSDARGFSVDSYTVSGTSYLWVKYYTGAPGQTADAELVARANPSARWGDYHTATGHAYMIVTVRYNADLYSSALPAFSSVWKGLKLYDWRKDSTVAGGSGTHRWGTPSTYEWTKNPYVIRWNFRRGIYVGSTRVLGLGYPFFAQDVAYYTAAANRADETFHDPETDTTFPVYEFGREITDAEDKMAILQQIDDAGCGTSFKLGGADAPLPATQQTSVLTLTDDDRVLGAPVQADRRGLVSGKKTAWAGQFISEASDWNTAPYQIRVNTDLETTIGGRRTVALDQPYEYSEPRAQMRAEIALRRQQYAGTRTETFGPKARQLDVGDCITRSCSWGDITMIVTRKARTDDLVGVTLDLAEWDNSIVPASGDSFVTLPPDAGTSPASPDRMTTVANPTAVAYPVAGGGATHAGIKFGCDAITDQSVDQWIVRYWPSAGTEAADGKTAFGSRYNRAIVVGDTAPETEYSYWMTISTTPYRATVQTTTATVTTGSESIPATVEDGTIDFTKLVNDLQNIVGANIDALYARVAGMETDLGDLAMVVADNAALHQEQITGLSVRNDAAAAAIVITQTVAIEAAAALASYKAEVSAVIGPVGADAVWKVVTSATPETGISSFSIAVKATDGTFTASAAFELLASIETGGVVTSQFNVMANNINFVTDTGDFVVSPFYTLTVAGTVYTAIGNLLTDNFKSLDLTSFEINGRTDNDYSEPFIKVTGS